MLFQNYIDRISFKLLASGSQVCKESQHILSQDKGAIYPESLID